MPRSMQKLTGNTPNVDECRTEFVTDHLSRCLANRSSCRYSFPADTAKTYCMHKNHGNFRVQLVKAPSVAREHTELH